MEEHWRSPGFVAAAHAWIDDRLRERGVARTGAVAQPHVRPWSTAMRVPTTAGDVWFKANHPALAHEAAVTALLVDRAPDRTTTLLAHDPASGWMLTADGGRRLREAVEAEHSLARWHDVLDAYARIQLACRDDVPTLLALGVPDLRLHRLPQAYAEVLDDVPDLVPRLPAPERIAELCDELAGHGIAETIEHDDLHDAQVFVPDDPSGAPHLLLDWGDACVAHPFFTLAVTLEGVIAWGVDDEQDSEDTAPYLESYLGPFREQYPSLTDAQWRAAATLGTRLGWVCRAANGRLAEEPESTRRRLLMFLDGRC